jgi:hypothetical protein
MNSSRRERQARPGTSKLYETSKDAQGNVQTIEISRLSPFLSLRRRPTKCVAFQKKRADIWDSVSDLYNRGYS